MPPILTVRVGGRQPSQPKRPSGDRVMPNSPRHALAVLAACAVAGVAPPASASAAPRGDNVITGSYIVVYGAGAASPAGETAQRERRDGFRARHVYSRAVKGFSAKLAPGQVKKLQADPEVAFVT